MEVSGHQSAHQSARDNAAKDDCFRGRSYQFRAAFLLLFPQFADCAEFLVKTLERLHEEAQAGQPCQARADSEAAAVAGFALARYGLVAGTLLFLEASTVRCPCGAVSQTHEELNHLELPIPNKGAVHLEDGLAVYFSTEVLNTNNRYQCSRCRQYVQAEKALRMITRPNFLLIVLKRATSGQGAWCSRLETRVQAPKILEASALGGPKEEVHELAGVISHNGLDGAGHFDADICGRHDGIW